MPAYRHIWRHEVHLADAMARELTSTDATGGRLFSPTRVLSVLRRVRSRRFIRKNLLFTKRLAFQAACEVNRGQERATAFRFVEIRTREILDKDSRGLYTDKVRKKQLQEIELLLDHYLKLMLAGGASYGERLRAAYPTRRAYEAFLDRLEDAEAQVLNASKSSLRRGSKRQRVGWFDRVRDISTKVRRAHLDRVYPKT